MSSEPPLSSHNRASSILTQSRSWCALGILHSGLPYMAPAKHPKASATLNWQDGRHLVLVLRVAGADRLPLSPPPMRLAHPAFVHSHPRRVCPSASHLVTLCPCPCADCIATTPPLAPILDRVRVRHGAKFLTSRVFLVCCNMPAKHRPRQIPTAARVFPANLPGARNGPLVYHSALETWLEASSNDVAYAQILLSNHALATQTPGLPC